MSKNECFLDHFLVGTRANDRAWGTYLVKRKIGQAVNRQTQQHFLPLKLGLIRLRQRLRRDKLGSFWVCLALFLRQPYRPFLS